MADGKTYQKTVANTETMIAEWIETTRSLDRSIPEPRGQAHVCLACDICGRTLAAEHNARYGCGEPWGAVGLAV